MKHYLYDPKLILGISSDAAYTHIFFTRLAQIRNDPHYIPKARSCGDFTMKCPLHPETRPSMRLDHRSKILKCFGCGKAVNILSLVMQVNHISFIEAVEYVQIMRRYPDKFKIFDPTTQIKIELTTNEPWDFLQACEEAKRKMNDPF